MSSFNFTVTEVTYGFTATIATPATLTLTDHPEDVNVTTSLTTVTSTSTVQSVTVTGAGSGQSFNQSLNTTDHVTFASVTTHEIFGQSPVSFPTGIDVTNVGQNFIGDIDMTNIYNTFTNQMGLLFALLPLDFGTVTQVGAFSVDIGTL